MFTNAKINYRWAKYIGIKALESTNKEKPTEVIHNSIKHISKFVNKLNSLNDETRGRTQ